MKKYSIILFLGSMILNASDGEKEADKKKGGIYKSTYPLHYAVLAEGYEQVKILCKTHPHLVNMYDHQSYSPLRRAVDASRADVVKLLLEHGAPSVEEKCPLGIDVRYRYMTVYAIEKGKTAALAGCFLPKKMTAERDIDVRRMLDIAIKLGRCDTVGIIILYLATQEVSEARYDFILGSLNSAGKSRMDLALEISDEKVRKEMVGLPASVGAKVRTVWV